MQVKSMCSILGLVALLGAAGLYAQETAAPSVEGRLLQILRTRGVIDAAEFTELSSLEKQLRESAELEQQVSGRVEEMVAQMQDAAPKTSWKSGKGFNYATADGKYSMTLGGRVQVRATHDGIENAADKLNFAAQRVRIWVEGHIFAPEWKYRLQFDPSGDRVTAGASTSSASATALREAYLEYASSPALNVRFGQFKTPYSRQWLTSSGSQEFVDRWVGNGQFTQNYQPGLMVHGAALGEKNDLIDYAAGVFNGNGINVQQTSGGDDMMMVVGRVAVNPFGAVKYSESDFAGGDFKAALGINAWTMNNTTLMADDCSIGADITVVGHGLYATSEFHRRTFADNSNDRVGFFAQAGYFVDPGVVDVGLRYARFWVDGATSGLDDTTELLGVLGYYIEQHNVKLQLDAGSVSVRNIGGAGDTDEFRIRLQAQIIF